MYFDFDVDKFIKKHPDISFHKIDCEDDNDYKDTSSLSCEQFDSYEELEDMLEYDTTFTYWYDEYGDFLPFSPYTSKYGDIHNKYLIRAFELEQYLKYKYPDVYNDLYNRTCKGKVVYFYSKTANIVWYGNELNEDIYVELEPLIDKLYNPKRPLSIFHIAE